MKQRVRFLLLLALGVLPVLLTACAKLSMMARQDQPPQAGAGEALIIFVRDTASTETTEASASLYDVTAAETKFIGIINPGTKLAYAVKPGQHTFMVLAYSTDFLEASVAAGPSYYAQVFTATATTGFSLKPRTMFRAIRKSEFEDRNFRKMDENAQFVGKAPGADAWYARSAPAVAARRAKLLPEWLNKPREQRTSQTLNVADGR